MSVLRALALATATLAACSQPEQLGPAPYVAPAVGTIYNYVGFRNTVLASEGWRVRFADDSGRQATRVGVFITDDPREPSQIDSAKLASLWPLETGKEVSITIRSGTHVSRWMFHVIGQTQVAVPAGTFQTYVVQGVQRPEQFTDPKTQTTFAFTWWYAPQIAAVVRFETRYYSGPAVGQLVRSMLRSIDKPRSGSATTTSRP